MTLTPIRPPSSRRPALILVVGVITAFCLVAASRGLVSGYSYWSDELFSVAASQETWNDLYAKWILLDVHPPLYQATLKLWIGLFGSSEISTRMLSFCFAIGALLIFALEAIRSRQKCRVTALVLMGLSPAFSFYSQETRSYSMALMLASLVTVLALSLRGDPEVLDCVDSQSRRVRSVASLYYIAAFSLSLTHYFGWIYVFSLSIVNFLERRVEKRRWRTLLLIVLISLWPAWHLFAGELGGKTGGDFWITQSRPIIGTINNYLQGCLQPLALAARPIHW